MEWIAPALVALGGIITAIAAWQRAKMEKEVGLSGAWQEYADGVKKDLDGLRARLREMEEEREADSHEIDAQQERIRELEQKERAAAERLLQVENEHEKLKNEHSAMKTAFSALEARFERYKRGVVLLIKQIVEHGLEPAWKPDDENKES